MGALGSGQSPAHDFLGIIVTTGPVRQVGGDAPDEVPALFDGCNASVDVNLVQHLEATAVFVLPLDCWTDGKAYASLRTLDDAATVFGPGPRPSVALRHRGGSTTRQHGLIGTDPKAPFEWRRMCVQIYQTGQQDTIWKIEGLLGFSRDIRSRGLDGGTSNRNCTRPIKRFWCRQRRRLAIMGYGASQN